MLKAEATCCAAATRVVVMLVSANPCDGESIGSEVVAIAVFRLQGKRGGCTSIGSDVSGCGRNG